MPSARQSTPAVCVAATVRPSRMASRTEPRLPTRYAAITVLPCPGDSACTEPRAIEASTANKANATDGECRDSSRAYHRDDVSGANGTAAEGAALSVDAT